VTIASTVRAARACVGRLRGTGAARRGMVLRSSHR
jgi:hypothetical protein